MSMRDPRHEEPLVVRSADALLFPATRRDFIRRLCMGGSVLMLPSVFAACSDDDENGDGNPMGPDPVTGASFDLRTDVGIFRFSHALEQLEAAFYTAVVTAGNFNTLFSAEERELLTDIRDTEVTHRDFLRQVLGSAAVPDLTGSINTTTLSSLIASRASVLATARMIENTGVAALNGAGKYIQDARNLLVAGKLVSVEARHAAALRDVLPPAGANANTAFAGDDITDANGRDVKLEAAAALERVAALNLLRAGTLATPAITNAPTAAQGVPSADFFPANA